MIRFMTTATPEDTAATESTEPTDPKLWGKLGGIIVGLVGILTLMLLAFLTPQYNSGPSDLPLAVAGPAPAVEQVTGALDQQQPGAFDVATHDSPDAARDAVANRDAIGAIAVGPDGATVYTATAAGQPYAQLLTGIASGLEAQGQDVTVEEVAPTTEDDPNAAGLSVLALPLAFGGIISAVLLSLTMKKHYGMRILGVLVFAGLAGLAIGAILQYGFGTFDGHYWALSGILGLGIAGTSMVVMGLHALLGMPGIGLGALFTILISNPLSGIATGWQWLPSPWGAIGQFLPIGAAGDATRSIAFFDGAAIAQPVWVLLAWVAAGLVLVGVAAARDRRATQA